MVSGGRAHRDAAQADRPLRAGIRRSWAVGPRQPTVPVRPADAGLPVRYERAPKDSTPRGRVVVTGTHRARSGHESRQLRAEGVVGRRLSGCLLRHLQDVDERRALQIG